LNLVIFSWSYAREYTDAYTYGQTEGNG
jgi:hypothetical protein